MSDVFCSVCGKDLSEPPVDDSELRVSNIAFALDVKDNATNHKQVDALQRQFGPYPIGRKYLFCWECILRALGVKPPEPENEYCKFCGDRNDGPFEHKHAGIAE